MAAVALRNGASRRGAAATLTDAASTARTLATKPYTAAIATVATPTGATIGGPRPSSGARAPTGGSGTTPVTSLGRCTTAGGATPTSRGRQAIADARGRPDCATSPGVPGDARPPTRASATHCTTCNFKDRKVSHKHFKYCTRVLTCTCPG